MKLCLRCHIEKPLTEFYQRKHGKIGYCKLCELAENKAYIKSEHGANVYRRVRQRYDRTDKGRLKYARYRKTDTRKEISARDQAKRRTTIENMICDFSIQEWKTLLQRYDHRCAYCLRPNVRLTRDHVIPLAKGGQHTASNIVPACRNCNSQKHVSIWTPIKAT